MVDNNLVVAPAMGVHGPTLEGPLSHWKVSPEKIVLAAGLSVRFTSEPEQTVAEDVLVVNDAGAPAQGGGIKGKMVIR